MSLQLNAGSRPASIRSELRHEVPRLLAGAIALYLVLGAAGLLITKVLVHGSVGRWDRGVSRWFYDHRTDTLNQWTHIGTMLSDTVTAIAVTAVLVVALRLWRDRWRESVVIVVSILGELAIFLLVTSTVHRTRPSIPHLDPAPPTSSFPSGHTGAAVALYVGLAVILLRTSRQPSARPAVVLVACVLFLVPVTVALSRVYRGMHFATDVLAGGLAGGLWMALVVWTLMPPGTRDPDL